MSFPLLLQTITKIIVSLKSPVVKVSSVKTTKFKNCYYFYTLDS